jgi:EAL domain-containing protein (putative c-di-GMP-specific phosphodiesterase class I)
VWGASSAQSAILLLEILPYVKLRPGRHRRYEVLPRTSQRDTNRTAATLDTSAVQQLTGWLGAHRAAWSLEPTSFTLNLSIDTLEDERFLREAAGSLKTHSLAPDSLGFEIAEALCTQHRAQVERFIASCEQLGCFVAIDDFSFDSAVLPLLRSRAVRLVKIDPRLTSAAQRDKLSQATVIAIIQAARVLGIDCSAQGVDSQSTLQWLKTNGCDLAQGPLLAQPQRLDSLG